MLTHRSRTLAIAGTISGCGLLFAACTTDGSGDANNSDPTAAVVATTTQVGSIAEQITQCAGGETQILMSAGDDPHQFEASSAQIADMVTADLVLINGLGLEASMQRSIENAESDGAEVFEVAPQLDPLPLGDDHDHEHDHGESEESHDHAGHEHDHGEDEESHEHGSYDSHVWLDVARMADGAELVGERIAETSGDDTYVSCGADVAESLRETDAEIEDILGEMDSPRLVTDHAAYGYFADRYGIEISGVVIPGGSTDGEPSSQDLASLTSLLDDEGADALVTSKANTNRMISALAQETEQDIPVVELYESAIGEPGSDAETYQDAMLYNANALAEAVN
ncbi:MAG: zinc ABC transporter substrate-binding protein [Micrococcaceae bacterium]|nr:zinc ABC transporter substrate-binding protein [Micrococcaceae bacterium]